MVISAHKPNVDYGNRLLKSGLPHLCGMPPVQTADSFQGRIKVFEGQSEVGEVASIDLREDKLFAVAGPGAGVFKGWELYCGVWSRALELLNFHQV